MNEHDFFKKMIHDRMINDAVIKARIRAQEPKPFTWKKALTVAAASVAVLIGTVFLIPAARAEVLSWFGVSTPGDYLTVNPDERTEIPEIDALIASPEPSDGFSLIPIDRTASNAVNSEAALKLSDFFYENCDIALGDAMFDGQFFYQTIRLNGLSGLYLLEQWTGGYQTGVPVDPYAVWGLYENGPEKEYLSGKWTLYERPEGRIYYELPDGRKLYGMLDLSSALEPYYDSLFEQGLLGDFVDEAVQEKIDAQNRAYLEENGLMAVASIYADEDVSSCADADGNLTAKVFYIVDVCEEDRGDGSFVPSTELFIAQLGTITVNMRAYQDLAAYSVEIGDSVIWGDEAVTLSKTEVDFGKHDDKYADDRVSLMKQRVSMQGVAMRVEEIEMNALGIHSIRIRITVPEAWTLQQREALADSLHFEVLINGERGEWYVNGFSCRVQDDGSILFSASELSAFPYDMLKSVKTLSFLPKLEITESVEPHDRNGKPLGTLNPGYGETAWSAPGVTGWDRKSDFSDFPQYALVLTVR